MPLELATNRAEVAAAKAVADSKSGDATTTASSKPVVVRPRVPLQACIDAFASLQLVDGWLRCVGSSCVTATAHLSLSL